MPASNSLLKRRHDIDALRVIALGLLIIYHTLLVFEPIGWRVTSDHAGRWAILLAETMTPWRLEVIFAIGGIAAAFLLSSRSVSSFLSTRSQRLLIPFVFGVIVLVPPQIYVHLLHNGEVTSSYMDFWLSGSWFTFDHDIPMPDLAHVWFLPYLFLYSALLAWLLAKQPGVLQRARARIERKPIWVIVAFAVAWNAIVQTLPPPFPNLWKVLLGDIPAHLLYAPAFFVGFLIAGSERFWNGLTDARRSLGLLALAAMLLNLTLLRFSQVHPSVEANLVANISKGVFGGAMVFAVFAWGRWALCEPIPGLAYATDAILPVYLLHQTVLVVVAYASGAIHWPVILAMPFLALTSFALPLLVYHLLIRNVSWLRFLFGLKAHPAKAAA